MSKLQKQSNLQTQADELVEKARNSGRAYAVDCINAGVVLLQVQNELSHHGDGTFGQWLGRYGDEKGRSTLYNWMAAAKNSWAQIYESAEEQKLIPAGVTIDLPPADIISNNGGKLEQLWFDLIENTTISEAIRSVVGGESPAHRITRAANGKKHGGSKGEDRKNWPQFIGEKLADVSAHLKFWKSFTPAQVETTHAKLDAFVAKVPTPLLTHLKQRITEELKGR